MKHPPYIPVWVLSRQQAGLGSLQLFVSRWEFPKGPLPGTKMSMKKPPHGPSKNFALADWALAVRKSLGMTQDEFAATLGFNRTAVGKWGMSGPNRQNPGRDAVVKIWEIAPPGTPAPPGFAGILQPKAAGTAMLDRSAKVSSAEDLDGALERRGNRLSWSQGEAIRKHFLGAKLESLEGLTIEQWDGVIDLLLSVPGFGAAGQAGGGSRG